jgi:hypothetical protein
MITINKPPAVRTEKRADKRRIRNLTEELSREDFSLGIPLLNAAVASVILGFKPSDREMRTQALRCWEILSPNSISICSAKMKPCCLGPKVRAAFPPRS